MIEWSTFGIFMAGLLVGCIWMGLSCLACAWLAIAGRHRDEYFEDQIGTRPLRTGNVVEFPHR